MNALDIPARGLARNAQDTADLIADGSANLRMRSAETAAATEALAAEFAALTGHAGDVHTVETAPYLRRDRLVIRGNGAELRNINQTPLSGLADAEQAALPIGTSNVWTTDALTYYAILSSSGVVLTVAAGDGDNFAAGDLVVVHGAAHYFVPGDEYNVYRNYTRARVVSSTASTIVLDRLLPEELLADAPIIANADQGIPAGFGPQYYLLSAPHISNLTIGSDVGETLKWGGAVDGTFRDLTLIGRNGIALNALQDCVLEDIHFQAWRKICELGEGSYGTTVRNMRGSLSDASTKKAGTSDVAPFFIGIDENCAECVFEDFDINSGPNNTTFNACQIGSGRNNEIRNSTLRFPANTGPALAIQSNANLGHGVVDSGYRNVTVHAPVCSRFFIVNDAGGGMTRPYFKDCRFFGVPSVGAGLISGDDGLLENLWCERGALAFIGTPTNWTIRDCYFPDGFSGLTDAILQANTLVDNESDASRRLNAAASVTSGNTVAVTTTTANTPYKWATFAAGDLAAGDRIFVYVEATAGGSGGSNRQGRLSVTSNGATTGIGGMVKTAQGSAMFYEAEIHVLTDVVLSFRANVAGAWSEATVVVSSLAANGLTVNVEYWCGNTADPVNTRVCRIIPVKRGMRHLPIK